MAKPNSMEESHKWIVKPSIEFDDEIEYASNENADPNYSNINTMNI